MSQIIKLQRWTTLKFRIFSPEMHLLSFITQLINGILRQTMRSYTQKDLRFSLRVMLLQKGVVKLWVGPLTLLGAHVSDPGHRVNRLTPDWVRANSLIFVKQIFFYWDKQSKNWMTLLEFESGECVKLTWLLYVWYKPEIELCQQNILQIYFTPDKGKLFLAGKAILANAFYFHPQYCLLLVKA